MASTSSSGKRSLGTEFCLGAVSTSSACLFSNPMEVIKTRMQVQGEQGHKTRAFKNSFHAFQTIIKNEGIKGIQKGLGPAIAYQITMNGSRLGSYEPIKRQFNAFPENSYFFMRTLAAGALSGALGKFTFVVVL